MCYFVGYESDRLGREHQASEYYHEAATVGAAHQAHFLPQYAALLIQLDPYAGSPPASPEASNRSLSPQKARASPASSPSPNKSSPKRKKSPKKSKQGGVDESTLAHWRREMEMQNDWIKGLKAEPDPWLKSHPDMPEAQAALESELFPPLLSGLPEVPGSKGPGYPGTPADTKTVGRRPVMRGRTATRGITANTIESDTTDSYQFPRDQG